MKKRLGRDIKQINRALVMKILLENPRISRTEVSKISGITKGGLTPIIQELLEMRLIREAGEGIKSTNGRRGILLEVCREDVFVVSVNWNRRGYTTALVDILGGIVEKQSRDLKGSESQEEVLLRIRRDAETLIKRYSHVRVLGIAFAAPGPLDSVEGRILRPPAFNGWENIEVKRYFEEELSLPLYLENDAAAAAYAERVYGLGKGAENYIYIAVNEGVGSGIVMDSEIFRGSNGYSSELGHISINHRGRRCECGNRGCLELYASTTSILERVNRIPAEGRSRFLQEKHPLEWRDCVRGYAEGEKQVTDAVEDALEYLGSGIVSAINLFEPDRVIIGGQLAEIGEDVGRYLKGIAGERSIVTDYHSPEIGVSEIRDPAVSGIGLAFIGKFILGEFGEYESFFQSEEISSQWKR